MLNHLIYKYRISISYRTQIGRGFYISHIGGIIIHTKAVRGKNCNLSQDITIGISNRGDQKGCPSIGDNVYIRPGAKIFGNIHIGNNVAIGVNCVVTHDVPDQAVVVGVPGRVISYEGSANYIHHTDYEKRMTESINHSKETKFSPTSDCESTMLEVRGRDSETTQLNYMIIDQKPPE